MHQQRGRAQFFAVTPGRVVRFIGDGVRRTRWRLLRCKHGCADRSALGAKRNRRDWLGNLRRDGLEIETLGTRGLGLNQSNKSNRSYRRYSYLDRNMTQKLPREFYTRPDVLKVSRDLLGKLLVVPTRNRKRVSGMIVEVEAYRGPEDRASHAFGGRRTKRTETMYKMGGVVYVYFVYGMYYQFNVVSNVADIPHAILVRALEPVEGIEFMRKRRHTHPDHNLTNGPGKLCMAMSINRELDEADLLGNRVWLEEYEKIPASRISKGPRIGIDYAEDWVDKPWRFWIKDNSYVSRK